MVFFGGAAAATSFNGNFEGSAIVKLFANGKEVIASDVPAIIYKDRTVIPVYLLKQLGVNVTWHSDTYSVDVQLPQPTPVIKIVHELTQAQLDDLAKSVSIVYSVDEQLNYNGEGSGFLLDNQLFITNHHVGSKNKAIQYYLNGKTLNNNGQTLFDSSIVDIYAVKTNEANGMKFTTNLPQIGDIVHALSYPNGKFAITEGTVTNIVTITGRTMIEFDAPIDDGSSGGALIDGRGQVIGIITSRYKGTNKNQALPLSYMQDELNKLQSK